MRVVLVTGIAGTVPQSMRNYQDHLARFLHGEGRADFVVESFTPRLSWLPRERRLRANYLDVAKLLFVPAQLRRLRADVFHLLDHSHGAWVRALGPQQSDVTCHDLIPFARPEMWRTRWGRVFGRRMFSLNVRRMLEARTVIAASRATQADLARFLAASTEAVKVVPMGVDTSTFRPLPAPGREQARVRLGLPADARILLHVGSCDHYKNVNGALRVLDHVRRRVPGAILVKVGESFRPANARLIDALSLGPATRSLGRLDTPALVDAYNAADALLFPSLYEGFGLPVLEAMACGTPVVASSAGALPEAAGDAALLCDPDDEVGLAEALVKVLQDAEERQRLIESGLQRACASGWDRTARQTLECYLSFV